MAWPKNLEEAYQAYLNQTEKEIYYQGVHYYRLVDKYGFHINGVWTIFIVVPSIMLRGKHLPLHVEDALGGQFTLSDPAYFSFSDTPPEWCRETLTFSIKNTPDVDWYIGIPSEQEFTAEQTAEEKYLSEMAPLIAEEIRNTTTVVKRPEGVEEWDGSIDCNHRWDFTSEAERIAVYRYIINNMLNMPHQKDRVSG